MKKSLILSASTVIFLLLFGLNGNRQGVWANQKLAIKNDTFFQDSSTGILKVILLGSGAGPRIDLQQFGPSILIEAGDERFLFDCGSGSFCGWTEFIKLGFLLKQEFLVISRFVMVVNSRVFLV